MGVDIVAYGYAALVASGGIMGYAKAGKFYLLTITDFINCFVTKVHMKICSKS
jgi:hypothetical protein